MVGKQEKTDFLLSCVSFIYQGLLYTLYSLNTPLLEDTYILQFSFVYHNVLHLEIFILNKYSVRHFKLDLTTNLSI